MDQEVVRPQGAAEVVPLRVAAQPPPPVEKLLEQAYRIVLGLAALASDVLTEAVARTLGREPYAAGEAPSDEPSPQTSGLALVAGAAIGGAIEIGSWGVRAATTLGRTVELGLSLVASTPPVRDGFDRVGSALEALDRRWGTERPRDEEAASAFLRVIAPQVIDAVLDQVDLNELVRSRLDVNGVVETVDLDAIVRGLDIDRIIERVDVQALVDRLPLDEIVGRIDVDRVVAKVDVNGIVERLDLDAVTAKIDLDALVRRLDVTAIAREVIDELDLPEIIRESMGSMTTETVGGIRVQSMNADRAISRLVDRVLQRRAQREPQPTDTGPSDPKEPV